MKTKLVYVLTCAPEATYIEQALMAVWSARYYNPDAYIVLLTDDKTNELLVGKRSELLNYISEKIVVPFDADKKMHYRSRWLKTRSRELVKGEMLFVDCDTICCRSIGEVDEFDCEIGAVGDNNTLFQNDVSCAETTKKVSPICDISNEEYYFSSGVVYSKDTPRVHQLFAIWHQAWEDGVTKGINIDQPAFAKANIDMRHIITPIDDVYNCVLYTQNDFLADAAILHVSSSPLMSFLFKPKTLLMIREEGVTPWLKDLVLHVHATYMPYDYSIKHSSHNQRKQWIRDIAHAAKLYDKYVDNSYEDWMFRVRMSPLIIQLYKIHLFKFGTWIWMEYKRYQLRKKNNLRSNICLKG